jgi:hypothetical protein
VILTVSYFLLGFTSAFYLHKGIAVSLTFFLIMTCIKSHGRRRVLFLLPSSNSYSNGTGNGRVEIWKFDDISTHFVRGNIRTHCAKDEDIHQSQLIIFDDILKLLSILERGASLVFSRSGKSGVLLS